MCTWLLRRSVDRARDERPPTDRRRHTVPRPPSPREPRVDRRGMGTIREQSARQVLLAHAQGPRTAPRRSEELDRICQRRLRGARSPRETHMKNSNRDVLRAPAWRRYLTFWRTPIAQDVDDELRFHTNMRVKAAHGARHAGRGSAAVRRRSDSAMWTQRKVNASSSARCASATSATQHCSTPSAPIFAMPFVDCVRAQVSPRQSS